MNPQRMKHLRLARGLTLDALAAEMEGIVTKQSLSKYEKGTSQPSPLVLKKLAAVLRVSPDQLANEPSLDVEFLAYRKRSSLLKRDESTIRSRVYQALEDRVRVQELTLHGSYSIPPVQTLHIRSVEDAEKAAAELRDEWKLGVDPIASVSSVLEDHFIHVLEMEAPESFDGISAVVYDGGKVRSAAVISRRGIAGDRQRLNWAHELAHIALNVSDGVDEEKAALRFAGAFLAPERALYRIVGRNRRRIDLEELRLLKQAFRISMQALLRRFYDLEIISQSDYTDWCIRFSRMGWRKQELDPLPPEEPQWLRRNVLRGFAEGFLTHEDAERLLGEPIQSTVPLTSTERRAFMKLPIEERRLILNESIETIDTAAEEVMKGDGPEQK